MSEAAIVSDSGTITELTAGTVRHENPSINPFEVLESADLSQNGDLHELSSGQGPGWSKVTNTRKRQRVSSDGMSGFNEVGDFQGLSADEKLSLLYSEIHQINNKVDRCLELQNKVQYVYGQVTEHDKRLTLLEYKSIDIEARSRRNKLSLVP